MQAEPPGGSRPPGALSPAVVPLHRRAEPLPCEERGCLPSGLRELSRRGDPGPSPPAKVELGPAVREPRQEVVRLRVAEVADGVHVPPVRGLQADDVPRPLPALFRLLEVLEDDPPV